MRVGPLRCPCTPRSPEPTKPTWAAWGPQTKERGSIGAAWPPGRLRSRVAPLASVVKAGRLSRVSGDRFGTFSTRPRRRAPCRWHRLSSKSARGDSEWLSKQQFRQGPAWPAWRAARRPNLQPLLRIASVASGFTGRPESSRHGPAVREVFEGALQLDCQTGFLTRAEASVLSAAACFGHTEWGPPSNARSRKADRQAFFQMDPSPPTRPTT